MIKANKGKRFQQAVDAVEEFLKKLKAKQEQNSGDDKGKKEGKSKKPAGERKRKSSVSGPGSPTKKSRDQSPRKRGRPPKEDKDGSPPQPSSLKKLAMKTVSRFSWPPPTSEEDSAGDSWLLHRHRTLGSEMVLKKPSVTYQAISKRLKVSEEDTGSTSIQAADSTAINGNITPTDKKIGFLGLGLMGSGIVSNLLKMGHTVTVWNRTAEKCDLFIQEGAHLGRTPAEVVSTCDITFACVADPTAAKDLVLGPSGVLQGIRPGKCYVDMSTVDPETVMELAQVIVSRGGRFLEAPVAGNQQLSNDGMLMILAAGDHGVYEDCSSCFQAMGRTSFFLGNLFLHLYIVGTSTSAPDLSLCVEGDGSRC
ncbi:hypothetical protein GDO81_022266 [Engystomops pustulosus]|uniref:Cytokine-like nuclear factor N-PAC n=1 Tax=Engystomops pustulosus TaxID=76066 RepID=A0AAV6Z507_ENGPU|nr:hypothetical protein GDO81_022266 [Engystomops pustulosus]